MDTEKLVLGDWELRVRRGNGFGPHPLALLLHGWMGTEDVMWIFASRLPKSFTIAAPRAIFPAGDGYSWVESRTADLSPADAFELAVDRLESLADELPGMLGMQSNGFHIMGFSQGAAAAFAWLGQVPTRFSSLAALSGFVPAGVETRLAPGSLAGLPVFMAHGTLDDTVPLEQIEIGTAALELAGASLTLCIDDVGHKLSASCMRALGNFYKGLE